MYKDKKEGARKHNAGFPKVILVLVVFFGLVVFLGWKFMYTLLTETPPATQAGGSQYASEKQAESMTKQRWSRSEIYSKLMGKPATDVIYLLSTPASKTEHETADTNYQTWTYYDVSYDNDPKMPDKCLIIHIENFNVESITYP